MDSYSQAFFDKFKKKEAFSFEGMDISNKNYMPLEVKIWGYMTESHSAKCLYLTSTTAKLLKYSRFKEYCTLCFTHTEWDVNGCRKCTIQEDRN